MPISPDLGLNAARQIATLYADAEAQLLAIIARRLLTGVDAPEWAAAKLREITALRRDAQQQVATLTRQAVPTVNGAINGAFAQGITAASADLRKFTATSDVAFGRTNAAVVRAIAEETAGVLRATSMQILRSVDDIYRSTIASATGSLSAGVLTRRQATSKALVAFADQGVTGFVDRAGRNWGLGSYAEMAVRSASGRAAIEGFVTTVAANEHDLMIVSDVPEECELCRDWEGRVLSISGADPRYPSIDAARGDGLFHPGCRHSLGVFVPGLTEPPKGRTADPLGDVERQEQRYLERNVRRWKRRQAVGDPTAGQKVAEWQDRLKQHVESKGRKRLRYREQITSVKEQLPPPPGLGKVSGQLDNQVTRTYATKATKTLEAIDSVHDVSDLPKIPVRANNRMADAGRYRFHRVTDEALTIDVKFSASNPHPGMSLSHEVGHLIDHKGFPDEWASDAASAEGALLNEWWTALSKSKAYQECERRVTEGTWRTSKGELVADGQRAYSRYLVRPVELWARSYAQYVATRSGGDLAKELTVTLDRYNSYTQQWDPKDFEPIAKSIDDIFRRLGWRK